MGRFTKGICAVVVLGVVGIVTIAGQDRFSAESRRELEFFGIEFSESTFIEAARQGATEAVDLFFRGGIEEVATRPDLFEYALRSAVAAGNAETAALFLQREVELSPEALLEASPDGSGEMFQLFVEHNIDLNILVEQKASWFSYASTPLMVAALHGNVAAVEVLISAGVDVDKQAKYGETALMKVALGGHILSMKTDPILQVSITQTHGFGSYADEQLHTQIAKMLLDAGARIDVKDMGEQTALMWAARSGRLDITLLLLAAGSDIDAKNTNGDAALNLTAGSMSTSDGHTDVARALIDNGAKAKLTLEEATIVGMSDAVLAYLRKGASVHEPDGRGYTPLCLAALNGRSEVVELLIDYGSDIGHRTDDDKTPIQLALIQLHIDTVKVLKDRGAPLSDEEFRDTISRNYSLQLSPEGLVEAARDDFAGGVQALLYGGVDIDSPGYDGQTALEAAAKQGHIEMVQFLLDNGADPNATDIPEFHEIPETVVELLVQAGCEQASRYRTIGAAGCTPEALVAGVRAGSSSLVLQCLASGLPVDATVDGGATALMIAAFEGQDEIVEILLQRGADVNAQDWQGYSPLMGASLHGHEGIVRLLMSVGAEVDNKNDRGYTALMWAASGGHYKVVQDLLAGGAGVLKMNDDGKTPYTIAVSQWQLEVARLLIDAGYDPSVETYKDELADLYYEFTPGQFARAIRDGDMAATALFIRAGMDTDSMVLPEYYSRDKAPMVMIAANSENFEALTMLVEAGANINVVDESGENCLHRATRNENLELIRLLLELGADPNVPTIDEYDPELSLTPIMQAAKWDNFEIVELLLEYGASVDAGTPAGMRTFLMAIQQGNMRLVATFVEQGIDLQEVHPDIGVPIPALGMAIAGGHGEMAEYLLKQGADLHAFFEDLDVYGPPLTLAIAAGQSALAERLLSKNVDVNFPAYDGTTALMFAAAEGNRDMTALLIDRGAEVNATDDNGYTALLHAALEGGGQTIELLEKHGGSFTRDIQKIISGGRGQDALSRAIYNNETLMVEALLLEGVDPNEPSRRGASLLQQAIADGLSEIVDLLLDNGADPNQIGGGGELPHPLFMAVNQGSISLVEELLKAQAEVDTLDEYGRTALFAATYQSKSELVDLLLHYRANPNIMDKNGETALMFAAAAGAEDIVRDLISAGADVGIKAGTDQYTAADIAEGNGNFKIAELLRKSNR